MKRPWTREELQEAWTLGPDEHALVSGKRGSTRLGFAVLLRLFAHKGRFPYPEEVNAEEVAHVARQIGVPATEYAAYDHLGRTADYHRAQIREAFGFRPATVEDAEKLVGWLSEVPGIVQVNSWVGSFAKGEQIRPNLITKYPACSGRCDDGEVYSA